MKLNVELAIGAIANSRPNAFVVAFQNEDKRRGNAGKVLPVTNWTGEYAAEIKEFCRKRLEDTVADRRTSG